MFMNSNSTKFIGACCFCSLALRRYCLMHTYLKFTNNNDFVVTHKTRGNHIRRRKTCIGKQPELRNHVGGVAG